MSYHEDDLERMASSLGVKSGNYTADDGLGYDYELDCITLDDVCIFDAAGNKPEQYKKLLIPKEFPRPKNESIVGDILESGVIYEKEGWFVPSMALASSIVDKLIKTYGEPGDHPNWHPVENEGCDMLLSDDFPFNPKNLSITNSLVDYKSGNIVHYPFSSELKSAMVGEFVTAPSNDLTAHRRISYEFKTGNLKDFFIGKNDFDDSVIFLGNVTGGIAFTPLVAATFYGMDKFEAQFHGPMINWLDDRGSMLSGFGLCNDKLVISNSQMPNYQTRIPLVKVIEE